LCIVLTPFSQLQWRHTQKTVSVADHFLRFMPWPTTSERVNDRRSDFRVHWPRQRSYGTKGSGLAWLPPVCLNNMPVHRSLKMRIMLSQCVAIIKTLNQAMKPNLQETMTDSETLDDSHLVKCTGNPRVFPRVPVPVPEKTRTRHRGYGFWAGWHFVTQGSTHTHTRG
jgi:hypothetical protein